MAKDGSTKQVTNHDEVRRTAKARQQAARKAAALTSKTARDYRVGFKFERNDQYAACLARQKAAEKAEADKRIAREAIAFGQQVNAEINRLLDLADKGIAFVFCPVPPFVANEAVQFQAFSELWTWLRGKGKELGYEHQPTDAGLHVTKKKVAASTVVQKSEAA